MPKQVVPLTDPKCAAAKPRVKDYKLSDGQGLFLLVKSNGTRVWRMKYKRPDGREALATFGTYPATTLAAARERRRKALEWLERNTAKNLLNVNLPSELEKHGVLARRGRQLALSPAYCLRINPAKTLLTWILRAWFLICEQLQVAGEDLESLARDVPRMAEA